MRKMLLAALIVGASSVSFAQSPPILWEAAGNGNDGHIQFIQFCILRNEDIAEMYVDSIDDFSVTQLEQVMLMQACLLRFEQLARAEGEHQAATELRQKREEVVRNARAAGILP